MVDPAPAPPDDLDHCIQLVHAAMQPFRALQGLAEVLERAREAARFLAASQATCADLEREHAAARAAIDQARAAAADITARAAQQMDAAAATVRARQEEARRIIADAESQAARELAAARGECLAQQTAAAEAAERTAAATAELERVQAMLSQLNAQMADAHALLARAETIRAAMGG